MENDSLVSIIVPIYNIEKYIETCSLSLIKQTYRNIEIILVNDGSTDSSRNICEDLAMKDDRIRVIHKENKGLSSARNIGVKVANGEYVMFVDGDDWIEFNCIEKCIEAIDSRAEIDIVLFPYVKEYENNIKEVDLFKESRYYFNEYETRNIVLKKIVGPIKKINPIDIDNISTAWGKLYRKSIIEDIEFIDTKKIGVEDSFYNIEAFYNARCCKYISNTRYHYRKTNDKSLTNNFNLNNALLRENMYKMKEVFIKEKDLGIEFNEALNNRIIINLFGIIYSIVNSNLDYRTKIYNCKLILGRNIYNNAFNKFKLNNLEIKWRVFYWLCKYKRAELIIFILTILLNARK